MSLCIMPEQEAKPYYKWISIKDRLPPFWEQVLIHKFDDQLHPMHEVLIASYWCSLGEDSPAHFANKSGKHDFVTHWLPLPEFPKDE